VHPVRWTPPAAPPRARLAESDPPMSAPSRLPLPGVGPEDVVVDGDGRLLTGLADGRVLRIAPDTGAVETLANTGGRPLGLEALPDGAVLVCDEQRGLLRVDASGAVEVLVDLVDGARLTFASNVVADADGTIYFSASTRRFDLAHYRADLLEHSGTGRLFRRTPDGAVETLLDGLQFANGVVLAPDRGSVLVAETAAYRVTRYWLTGPAAGTSDRLVENLPGFPDNMSLGSDGLVWIALAAPRDPLLDRLLPMPGVIRKLVWALPERLLPDAKPTTWVLGVSLGGEVVHDLQRAGDYRMVTSVWERDGRLYLGSLVEDAIAVTRVPT
jgi:sugar lactone lactonase YvrE